ncbi:MAG: CAP domain-containing protein [Defluviitaleaceae bacterium]|nr:CAP domain-containing protein [Defluviitaleaceae bacterium]
MTRKLLATAFFAFVVSVFVTQPTHATDINVIVNGVRVNFADQQPTSMDGRTLVPVRGVFEELGFDVSWNDILRQVTLTRPGDTVIITIGSAIFTTNGTNHILDVPAQIIGNSTMLPIRAVLESIGYCLEWDGNTNTVLINSLLAMDIFALEFLGLVNAYRIQSGLAPLAKDCRLMGVASTHVRDAISSGVASNTGSDGRNHIERIRDAGIDLAHISATTVRFDEASTYEIFAKWIDDDTLYDQLLREFPTIAGIAVGLEQRPNNVDRIYIVLKVGRPAITAPYQFAQQVFYLINAERMEAKLNPLNWDEGLTITAQSRVENRRTGGSLAHRMNNNTNPVSPEFVVASWLEMDVMRERMLDEDATRIGVGYMIFAPDEDNENYHTHMIVFLATPYTIPQSADPFHPENLLDRGYSTYDAKIIMEQEVIRLTNIFRAEYGLEPLLPHSQIASFARHRADEYMEFGYISSHISAVTGNLPRYDAPDHGISGLVLENWAAGNMTPQATVNQWINLPVHRAQMLNTSNRYIGVGVAWNLDNDVPETRQTPHGEARFFRIQWSQMFGR